MLPLGTTTRRAAVLGVALVLAGRGAVGVAGRTGRLFRGPRRRTSTTLTSGTTGPCAFYSRVALCCPFAEIDVNQNRSEPRTPGCLFDSARSAHPDRGARRLKAIRSTTENAPFGSASSGILSGAGLGPQCGAGSPPIVGLSCADIGFTGGTLRTVARARIRWLVDRFAPRPHVEVFVTTRSDSCLQ